jgi:hypothetical protein
MTMNGDTINIGSSKLVIPGAKYISGGDAPASLSNGLVAYYPFNGNANDASGNKNHGVTNNVTLSPDRNNVPNSCYYFNGNDNSNIVVPHSSTLCPDNYLSISCWVRIKSSLEWNNIIVKRLSYYAFPYNSYILAEIANDSEVWKEKSSELLTLGITTEEIFDPQTNLFGPTNIEQWYHLSVVYDGTTVTGYTNGKKIISQSLKGKIKYSDLPLYFGYTGIDGQNFNGYLDEVRIYDRVLTQDEITFLANN